MPLPIQPLLRISFGIQLVETKLQVIKIANSHPLSYYLIGAVRVHFARTNLHARLKFVRNWLLPDLCEMYSPLFDS